MLFILPENLRTVVSWGMLGSFLGDLPSHNVIFCPNVVNFQDKGNFHLIKNSLTFFGQIYPRCMTLMEVACFLYSDFGLLCLVVIFFRSHHTLSVVFKVWFLGLAALVSYENLEKCKFSGLTPELLGQKLWSWDPAISVVRETPGDPDAC